MPAIRLVSWNQDLARERKRLLEKAGFTVDASPLPTSRLIGHFRDLSPAAILIDLDQRPSHGRAVGTFLRSSKSTCRMPIVFAGGPEEKVERIRHELPDALFTDWKNVERVLRSAMKNPVLEPIRTAPYMEQFAGASLEKKLGLKPAMKVALLGAPEDFELDGVDVHARLTDQTKLIIWFVRSLREVEGATELVSAQMPEGASAWIIYPKQTSRYRVDFSLKDVRAAAFAVGLVDYKVCSVDADWTGLKFARKKS
jgi:hypothetical protein